MKRIKGWLVVRCWWGIFFLDFHFKCPTCCGPRRSPRAVRTRCGRRRSPSWYWPCARQTRSSWRLWFRPPSIWKREQRSHSSSTLTGKGGWKEKERKAAWRGSITAAEAETATVVFFTERWCELPGCSHDVCYWLWEIVGLPWETLRAAVNLFFNNMALKNGK